MAACMQSRNTDAGERKEEKVSEGGSHWYGKEGEYVQYIDL